VDELRASIDKQRGAIAAKRDELKTIKTSRDSHRSAERIGNRLERDLVTYKLAAQELKAKEALLEARERALEADKEKLSTMRSQKEQWEVQIAQMETEVKLLQAAQTKSTFQQDNSKFERIKGLIGDIKNQIRTRQTAVAMEGQFLNDEAPSVQAGTKSSAQLIKEADEVVGQSDDGKYEAKK
jgi:hypothetical protein